jgi:predicted acylesterase/phospholipase RssA
MRGLVLIGGGALGAFEAGVVSALWQRGERFDIVCGSSIGAINASFIAQDKINELVSLWKTIGTREPPVIDYIDSAKHLLAFISFAETLHNPAQFLIKALPLYRLWAQIGSKVALLQLQGFVKPDALEEIVRANLDYNALKRSLIITATNLTFGTSDAFYQFVGDNSSETEKAFLEARSGQSIYPISKDNFAVAVRSSASIPGAFGPSPMNLGVKGNKEYVDGGVANNAPLSLVADAQATDILVVMLEPEASGRTIYPTANMLEIGLASFVVMQHRILEMDMNYVNSRPGINVRYVRPAESLPLGVLDFDKQDNINKAFDLGQQAVETIQTLGKGVIN